MYENPDGKILQDRNESSCNKHTQRQWKYKFVVKLHGKVLTVRLPRTCSFAFINLSNFTGSSQGNPANVIGIATTLYTARSRFQMPVTVMSFVSCKSSAKALWSTYTPRGELNYLAPLGSEAVFLSRGGGDYTPDWVKHHASQSQDRNNKYFVLYIEFVAADLLFRLARMRHAWKGDCYLTVLVFSWQILFLLS